VLAEDTGDQLAKRVAAMRRQRRLAKSLEQTPVNDHDLAAQRGRHAMIVA
jgi:hypothetical protein